MTGLSHQRQGYLFHLKSRLDVDIGHVSKHEQSIR